MTQLMVNWEIHLTHKRRGPGLQVVGESAVTTLTGQHLIAWAVGRSRRCRCPVYPNRAARTAANFWLSGGLDQLGLAAGLPTVVSLRRPGWTDAAAQPVSRWIGTSAARCDV